MSHRRAIAVAFAIAAAIGGLAALLAGDGADEPAAGKAAPAAEKARKVAASPAELRDRLAEAANRSAERQASRQARRESADGEPGPSSADLRHYDQLRAEAEPIARRFFQAFALYELGRGGRRVAADLGATATAQLVDQLFSKPPRRPPGPPAPEQAQLGRLEFVPGAVGAGRIVSAELVGRVHRSDAVKPIAIELAAGSGGWLVVGLGR
jgi:hypothetical protein